jgi:hypothetical protein
MARQSYVYRDGKLVEKRSGAVLKARSDGALACPQIIRDISEYRSPIDGRVIGSRSERREDLKRNGCIEWDPAMSPTRGKRAFKNERFARKWGLPYIGDQ